MGKSFNVSLRADETPALRNDARFHTAGSRWRLPIQPRAFRTAPSTVVFGETVAAPDVPLSTPRASKLSSAAPARESASRRGRIRGINSSHDKDDLGADGSYRSRPRYEACLFTMMKQFGHLLPEWVGYHRRLGFDHVVILDNAAPDDLAASFAARRDVEVVNWPAGRSQVQAMSFGLHAARARCEWVFQMDVDEYIMIGLEGKQEKGERHGREGDVNGEGATSVAGKHPLKLVLDEMRKGGYDSIAMKYLTMGRSGHTFTPHIPVPEAYIARHIVTKPNRKSGYLSDTEWKYSRIHKALSLSGARQFPNEIISDTPTTVAHGVRLVHYQFRSTEDWLLKRRFGSASISDRIINGDVQKVHLKLNKPPSEFADHLRYVHFRDIWRAVNRETKEVLPRLVLWRGDRRCVALYNDDDDSFGQELCADVERTNPRQNNLDMGYPG